MKFLNTLETIVKVVVALMVIALILSLLFENKTKPTEGQKLHMMKVRNYSIKD
jgi:hypothetical protein